MEGGWWERLRKPGAFLKMKGFTGYEL